MALKNQGNLLVTNGNVGIGTTSPSEKLEVNGNIKIGANQTYIAGELNIRHNGRGVGVISENTTGGGRIYFRPQGDFTTTGEMRLYENGSLEVNGSISGTSKNFKIDHPLPAKKDTHKLVHASIEAPRADLIYSGMVQLVDGTATVNIDTASNMTEGTFEALVGNVRRFCTNEGGFTRVKSSINGNLLTIEAEDPTCTDEIFWQVIGERKDAQILESNSTDNNGNLIVEPEIIVEEQTQEQTNN